MRSHCVECRAIIAQVEEGLAASKAGLKPGMVLTHVAGVPLTDMIEWRWQTDGFETEVTLESGKTVRLERELGQSWGLEFTDSVFDGIITCVNTCSFCFMRMLPPGVRPALYVRDDDYRLSFMQGNFITLTNLSEDDFERIVAYDISPLYVSVHAYSDNVREKLMGKNAPRGIEMLERLLKAGIEVHAQLVLVPHVNDGIELVKTLGWLERWPGVLSVGIVPLGYTRYQNCFSSSYSDDQGLAEEVIDIVREFQEDSRNDTRVTRFHLSDEFYLCAHEDFPPAQFYDGYPMFFDGIGMMRTFLDEFDDALKQGRIACVAREVAERGVGPAVIVVGTSFGRVLAPLIKASVLSQHLRVLSVKNNYYGGNVDVTGLLTASDIIPALKKTELPPATRVILPESIFNADGITLDDATLADIVENLDIDAYVCTYNVADILDAIV